VADVPRRSSPSSCSRSGGRTAPWSPLSPGYSRSSSLSIPPF